MIDKSKETKSPEMVLKLGKNKIYIECKFIEGRHDIARLKDACEQIEQYDNNPESFGAICLIYRVHACVPKLHSLRDLLVSGEIDCLPFEIEHTREFIMRALEILKKKRMIILLFAYIGAGFVEFIDAHGRVGYFFFTKADIDAWIEHIKKALPGKTAPCSR